MAKKKSAGKKKSAANNAAKAKPVEKLPADKSEATPETAPVKAKSESKPDTAKAKGADAKKQAKKPGKVAKYFRDLRSEFKKVVWPSKKTVVNNTGVVLVVMIGSALVMWGLDSGFAALLKGLLSLAGA
ncbi:MAG: preprotein translocase subunit SecE [Oscillospiraceae bacterium]|nr:preprotein translocase subunit SecE [Oscillospiraceae bacterium]